MRAHKLFQRIFSEEEMLKAACRNGRNGFKSFLQGENNNLRNNVYVSFTKKYSYLSLAGDCGCVRGCVSSNCFTAARRSF